MFLIIIIKHESEKTLMIIKCWYWLHLKQEKDYFEKMNLLKNLLLKKSLGVNNKKDATSVPVKKHPLAILI